MYCRHQSKAEKHVSRPKQCQYLILSMIYDNLCQYQPMVSPVAVDIDKSDFFQPLVKGVTRFIAAIQLLKMKYQKLPKNTDERIFL